MSRFNDKQKKTPKRARKGKSSLPDAPWRVYKPREAAILTGTSERTLQRFRVNGGGPDFVKLAGKSIGYSAEALQRWIKRRSSAVGSRGNKRVAT